MARHHHHEIAEHAFTVNERGRAPLWVEEPARRYRMPDPVRSSAVRAVLIISLTLVQVNVAVLGAVAGAWIAAPMTLSAVVSTIVATWAVLDVWITRQVHRQRHGVVSQPSSVARAPRRRPREAGAAEAGWPGDQRGPTPGRPGPGGTSGAWPHGV